jgi:hypothetical protein
MANPKYLAMWSGPRNISTAMLRSFGQRADAIVCDEPLYAHYLKATGLPHPGADEVIAHGEPDWERAVAALVAPLPPGKTLFYQKHMTHHLLPDVGRGWLAGLTNAFLIRDPREMLVSLMKNIPEPRMEDTGLPQQVELFASERARTGRTPVVIDARDVLTDPRRALGALCEALGIPFDEAMLAWPPGRRATDGIWAKHWYANVEKSTGFEAYRPREEVPPPELADLLARCLAHYETLHAHRLRI